MFEYIVVDLALFIQVTAAVFRLTRFHVRESVEMREIQIEVLIKS